MSDIMDELRGAYSTVFARSLAKRAADEIWRLRNHAMQDRLVLDENAREIKRLREEIERLRAYAKHERDLGAESVLLSTDSQLRDEIERLREENERLRAALRPWVDSEGGKLWVWPETARETALKYAREALNGEATAPETEDGGWQVI